MKKKLFSAIRLSSLIALPALCVIPVLHLASCTTSTATWDLFYYISSPWENQDDNEEADGSNVINNILDAKENKNIHIYICTGGLTGEGGSAYYVDYPQIGGPDGTIQFWEVQNHDILDITTDISSQCTSMSDPINLEKLVHYGVNKTPAQHYGLNIFGHGGAWQGMMVDTSQPDDRHSDDSWGSADIARMDDIKDALSVIQATDLADGKWDFILMNSCLMSNIEMLDLLSVYGNYFFGCCDLDNEDKYYHSDWNYTNEINYLVDHQVPNMLSFGKVLINDYKNVHDISELPYTVAMVDLSLIPQTLLDFNAFLLNNTAVNTEIPPQFAISADQVVKAGKDSKRYVSGYGTYALVDFEDYMKTIAKENYTTAEGLQTINDLEKAIMLFDASADEDGSYGISIYCPVNEAHGPYATAAAANAWERYSADATVQVSPVSEDFANYIGLLDTYSEFGE